MKTDASVDEKQAAIKAKKQVEYWKNQIQDAEKREKDYRKTAREVVKIYEMEEKDRNPYNILYSNTETLSSALYNRLPRPDVSRRFRDKDPLGKVTSTAIARFLEFFMDSNDRDYSNFDDMMSSAVQEALLPGRGVTRFKLDATLESSVDESGVEQEVVKYATVCGEEIPWDRIHFGYTKRWANLPWLAIDHFMSREELKASFGQEWVSKVQFDVADKKESTGGEDRNTPADLGEVNLCRICEVWDKDSRRVIFFAPSFPDSVIKEVDDPLKLSGFFPIPKPLMFGGKITSMVPIPIYIYYEEQAKELNRLTIRINKIINAIKVRGFYDSSLEGIDKVLSADDNTLLPAENVASLQEGRTIEKSIWLAPIDKYPAVLQQLYLQREQIKVIIHEITGIADIMRGSTKASETLGAQELKTQWGGLRLQTIRKKVQIYVRDCLRIVSEIGFKHIPPDILRQMVAIPVPTKQEQQQIMLQYQNQQQQAATMQQPPPPPPPELQSPAWEDIISLAQDDMLRNFKIDIETDSTVEPNLADEKKDMGEFLGGFSQFLNGALPLVQGGILPFPAFKAITGNILRKYRFGQDVEEAIEAMQPPPQQQGDPAAQAKAAAEQQRMQLEQQSKQMEMQFKQQEKELEFKLAQIEAQVKEAEMNLKLQEMYRKDQLSDAQMKSKLLQLQMKEIETANKVSAAARQQEMKEEMMEDSTSREGSDAAS